MQTDVLESFREGLAKGEFTITDLNEETEIPLATLSDMKDATWRPKIFERFEKLAAAMERLRAEPKRKPKEAGAKQPGSATNAA